MTTTPDASYAVFAAVGWAGLALGSYGAARHFEWIRPRVREIAELREWLTNGRAPYFGDWEIRRTEARARELDLTSPVSMKSLRVAEELAASYLRAGRDGEAIDLLKRALEAGSLSRLAPGDLAPLHFALGLAHLRSGEVNHCIRSHSAQSCLFPIQGAGVWANKESAQAAIQELTEVLRVQPADLGARWLLNIAYMVAGDPDGVPAAYRVPTHRNESYRPILPFRDVAPGLGLAVSNLAGGAILDDIDGDGRLDVVTSAFHPAEHMLYMHNDGKGGFEDWSERSGLVTQLGGFNLFQTDYNNDGRPDIYVARGAWMQAYGRQRGSLLRQNANGSFSDVTHESGLGELAYPTLAAGWADYDNDGDLDLFVAYEHVNPGKAVRSVLHRNEGDGTFREVSAAAGIDARGNLKAVAWGDYDNDGFQDLYLSNLAGRNLLYHNRRDGTFEEVGQKLGVDLQPPSGKTFAAWFFDYDNDGWLDLFVGGYGAETLDRFVADYLGQAPNEERLTLYRNDGTGHFVDVTKKVGLDHVQLPMGANFGDFDNDGWPDIYLGTGRPGFEFLVPNVLYHNARGERFVDVTSAAGVGHLQKGHAVAFGDVDNDGNLDLFAHMGGFFPADRFANALFQNPGYGAHWLEIRLVGVRSNRAAIGARVRALVESGSGKRAIESRVGSGGDFGASPLRVHLGLGDAQRISELEIRWPTTGTKQVFRDVPADRVLEIKEFGDDYRVLNLPRIELGREASRD